MDERLRALEKAAEQDPGDLAKLKTLAAESRRVGWRFQGKTVEGWIAELASVPESEEPVFWALSRLARSLEGCGIRAVPGLIAFLSAPPDQASKQASRIALGALTRLEGQAAAAIDALLPLCDAPGLRSHAVRALVAIDPEAPQVQRALAAILAAPEHPGRRTAAAGLAGGLIGVAESEAFIDQLLGAQSRALLYALPIAIARLAERDRAAVLNALPAWLARAASPAARALIYYGLPLFREELKERSEWLLALMRDEEEPLARRALLHALAKILGSHPRLLSALLAAASHEDEQTRCAAVRALQELDVEEAREAVRRAASDPSILVQTAAQGDAVLDEN